MRHFHDISDSDQFVLSGKFFFFFLANYVLFVKLRTNHMQTSVGSSKITAADLSDRSLQDVHADYIVHVTQNGKK